MNKVEREVYDEYAYDKDLKYIWLVYMEFVVHSENNECLFADWVWKERLNLSFEQIDTAIKKLTSDGYIELIESYGTPEKYRLNDEEYVKKKKNENLNEFIRHISQIKLYRRLLSKEVSDITMTHIASCIGGKYVKQNKLSKKSLNLIMNYWLVNGMDNI